jgi:bifunctional UDP-N-acetylglucosamine pyrophosphorylase/glucosamine-1-phosphate N-acetyltransferase
VEYLPLITNNNANKEYYLPDVIPMIKKQHKVDLYDVEQDNQYQITGVNTQEQLNILELIYQCT